MDLTVALLEKRTCLCVVQEEGVFKEYDVTTSKSSLYFLSLALLSNGVVNTCRTIQTLVKF